MRIIDLLRHKGTDVVTLPPDATIAEAVALLRDRGIGSIVISGPDQPVVGMIWEREVAHSFGRVSPDAPVSEIMKTDFVVSPPETSVEEVATLMTEHRVRHVPVVKDGQLRGLVSIGDVVKGRLDELAAERDHLVAYVQS